MDPGKIWRGIVPIHLKALSQGLDRGCAVSRERRLMIDDNFANPPTGSIPSQDPEGKGVPDPPLPFSGGRIPSSEMERKFVERRVMMQYFIAPAVAFAAIISGFKFEWPRLMALGVIGLGSCGLGIGYFAVRDRRLMFIRGGSMTRRAYRYFIYEGSAAIPYGLAYALGGACLIAPALLFMSGTSLERMREIALARPGLVLFPLGIVLLCYGLGFLIGFTHRGGSRWQRIWAMLLDAPARLGGLILIAIAIAALMIGGIELLTPVRFNQWFQSMFGCPWPFKQS